LSIHHGCIRVYTRRAHDEGLLSTQSTRLDNLNDPDGYRIELIDRSGA